ncbi:MAG TPA: hypothetical protein VIM73_11190, partial [Polyangiaceae bacterium]
SPAEVQRARIDAESEHGECYITILMRIARAPLVFLALLPLLGCRALKDDQETRPLPAPEPPPPRAASEPAERARPQGNTTRTVARAGDDAPIAREPEQPKEPPHRPAARDPEAPAVDPVAVATTPPEPASPAPPSSTEPRTETPENTCLDACRRTLATCVSAPSDSGGSLESCKTAFEACRIGCQT